MSSHILTHPWPRPIGLMARAIRHLLPLDFITIHYAYFILLLIVSSVVFYCSSSPMHSISYADSLFLVVSAMTETGLNTVNLSEMTTWQQTILFLLILFGGSIWVSIWTVLFRKHIFDKQFSAMRLQQARPYVAGGNENEQSQSQIPVSRKSPWERIIAKRSGSLPKLSCKERERLGGQEYRALRLLAIVVPLYSFLWQVLGCVGLGIWICRHRPDVALRNGIHPFWLGIFNGASAFNNSGMTLLDANMVPFQDAYYVLITMGLMILAGNTAYPIMLRCIFWIGLQLLKRLTDETQLVSFKETLVYILKYPRRVYTNMFPAQATWWLLFTVVLLNGIDWAGFELLNLGNPRMAHIPLRIRVIDGLFQAFAVRSGGFYIVPMTDVYIGLQILYVIMMYISVYPVTIAIRQSGVYEERSLGIYTSSESTDSDSNESPRRRQRRPIRTQLYFIRQQLHDHISHDLWLLVLAVLFISTIETAQFNRDPVHYSVWNVIFEVVSGYGCVGVSVGLPDAAMSFSGGWHKASKLVLCLVMLRGRHRGLPVALDHAIQLPDTELDNIPHQID